MKKGLVALAIIASMTFTGCGAHWENEMEKNGGLISSSADYIVINTSGDKIMDIWKLRDAFVSSESSSDGWSFIDEYGNVVMLGGDAKVIRVKDPKTWDKYTEYHYDEVFMEELAGE